MTTQKPSKWSIVSNYNQLEPGYNCSLYLLTFVALFNEQVAAVVTACFTMIDHDGRSIHVHLCVCARARVRVRVRARARACVYACVRAWTLAYT